ncbi:MAG: hypothetical protein DCC68_22290 [Planctomycetota bacterium]|nr:MAG: hypothetical protein DCC68_22290 [Planctomycetota bacterium]
MLKHNGRQAMSGDLQRTLAEFHDVLLPAGSIELAPTDPSSPDAETAYKRRLLAAGVISKINDPRRASFARDDFKPFKIEGKPLSETIIEERG